VSVLPPPSEKATYVAGMFGRIASGYDRMNRLMTFGLDDWWRQIVVRDINPAPDATMLDIGSGTGPFLPILRRQAPHGIAIGADFVLPMMQSGLHRLDEHSAFVCADAQQLPFAANAFDTVTAGFVIRNVSDIDACFREILRITKPGGRFAILEVARPQSTVIRWGHRMYFEEVMPRIAQMLGADPVAYRYLPESSRNFPDPPVLADMLRATGWHHVTHRHLPPNAVALHIATKALSSESSHE
jgi:demethylmenaquinone methyltransferase / 2-methoxy-6-polyprenyl-1,4-benzoquinol methylase